MGVPPASTEQPGAYDEVERLLKGLAPKAAQQGQGQEKTKAPAFPAVEAPGGQTMSLAQARQQFDPRRFYTLLQRKPVR